MIAMTEPNASVAVGRHPVMTAALVLLCWIGSAALVALAHARLDSLSATGSVVAVIVSIFFVAWIYMRLITPQATVTHALGVGIAWLVLTVVAEMIADALAGYGWYPFLGSPDRPLLRNIALFVWIFAPALFARRSSQSDSLP